MLSPLMCQPMFHTETPVKIPVFQNGCFAHIDSSIRQEQHNIPTEKPQMSDSDEAAFVSVSEVKCNYYQHDALVKQFSDSSGQLKTNIQSIKTSLVKKNVDDNRATNSSGNGQYNTNAEMPNNKEAAVIPISELKCNYFQNEALAQQFSDLSDQFRTNVQGVAPEWGVKASPANENPSDKRATTTVMIRNVPYKYSIFELEQDVETAGFGDVFDCLYLPRQDNLKRNLGYAFMNFPLPEHASHFMEAFGQHKFKWHGRAVHYKRATVSAAYFQGHPAMLEKLNELMGIGGLELVSGCFRVKRDLSVIFL